jgi:hypothetical protein
VNEEGGLDVASRNMAVPRICAKLTRNGEDRLRIKSTQDFERLGTRLDLEASRRAGDVCNDRRRNCVRDNHG